MKSIFLINSKSSYDVGANLKTEDPAAWEEMNATQMCRTPM
jgi:hypothetical protein